MILNANELSEVTANGLPGTVFVQCTLAAPDAQAKTQGAAGYLVKPVTRDDLAAVLAEQNARVKRALIVDDDPEVCQLFSRMLQLCDHSIDVQVASDGREGLDKMRQSSFDLVLLDVVMPGVSGWQVLAEIKSDPETAGASVYFLTAQDPVDGASASPYLTLRAYEGFTARKLLRCSLEVARCLVIPETELDPAPARSR